MGQVELKPPVWLNALDRVLESARRCRSLDELLHGGVLEQGRKAKGLAGDLFYLPVALVAFTRFGYLMRRSFFRLMLGDLNSILDGLTELEDKGVETIDCRRAQFSAQEPIIRLRMICQSWKVMFQAEYSSGQPLRMLVDLRASVEQALGRGESSGAGSQSRSRSCTAKPRRRERQAQPRTRALRRPQLQARRRPSAQDRGCAGRWPRSRSRAPGLPQVPKPPSLKSPATPGWDPDSNRSRAKRIEPLHSDVEPAARASWNRRRKAKEEVASGSTDRTDHLRRSRFLAAHHCPLADGAQRSRVHAAERRFVAALRGGRV